MDILKLLYPSVYNMKMTYKDQVNEHNKARETLQAIHDQYSSSFKFYQSFVAYTAGIAMSASALKMTSTQFDDLVTKYSIAPGADPNPIGISPDIIKHFEEVTGGSYILSSIYSFQQIGKDKSFTGVLFTVFDTMDAIDNILNGIAIGGLALIPGTDKIPALISHALLFPLQILAAGPAVALDIALTVLTPSITLSKYALQYQNEKNETDKVNNAINEIYQAMNEIKQALLLSRNQYFQMAQKLNVISPQDFLTCVNAASSDQDVFNSLSSAFEYFGLIPAIIKSWKNTKATDPSTTKSSFKVMELLKIDRNRFSRDQLSQIIDVALTNY